jgi:hypothetical protein
MQSVREESWTRSARPGDKSNLAEASPLGTTAMVSRRGASGAHHRLRERGAKMVA